MSSNGKVPLKREHMGFSEIEVLPHLMVYIDLYSRFHHLGIFCGISRYQSKPHYLSNQMRKLLVVSAPLLVNWDHHPMWDGEKNTNRRKSLTNMWDPQRLTILSNSTHKVLGFSAARVKSQKKNYQIYTHQ